jgi:hypothetical protein
MPLKDVLTKPAPKQQKGWLYACKDKLDADDYEYLLSVLQNEEEFSAPYIANIMSKQGFPVSATTVLATRRKLNG